MPGLIAGQSLSNTPLPFQEIFPLPVSKKPLGGLSIAFCILGNSLLSLAYRLLSPVWLSVRRFRSMGSCWLFERAGIAADGNTSIKAPRKPQNERNAQKANNYPLNENNAQRAAQSITDDTLNLTS